MSAAIRSTVLAPAIVLGLFSACSSGDSGNGDPSLGNTHVVATIDGARFTANAASITTGATAAAGDNYQIVATDSTNAGTSLTLNLYNIQHPGTYPLGVGTTVFGGIATLAVNGTAATTPLSGNAGTVTVDVQTASRLAGTFSFTTSGAGGTHTVSQGDFDLGVHGTGLPAPDSIGGSLSGGIGGQPWTAAAVAAQLTGATPDAHVLSIQASNTTYRVEFVLPGVDAVGVFPLPGTVLRTVRVTSIADPTRVWGGSAGLTGGGFGVDSVTATRIGGTFAMTLLPAPGNPSTTSIDVSGSYALGLSH